MSVAQSDSTYSSSMASYHLDNTESLKVKNYVKDLLKSRIFLGRYLERRLANERIGYRDVVLISPAEVDLKKDLLEALYKLLSIYPNINWIGITEGELIGNSGVCLWTEIDNRPFGIFWFQVKSVKFREEEIILTVKCIRQITESFLEIEPILTGSSIRKTNPIDCQSPVDNNNTQALTDSYNEIVNTLKGALSIRNIKEFVTFLCAFVIAVFTGSSAFINFLGNFILALIREISILIKNSTPLFLGFLDFLSKIVGGFYILMAMFFKPSHPLPPNRRSITYSEKQYRPRHSYDDSYSHTNFD